MNLPSPTLSLPKGVAHRSRTAYRERKREVLLLKHALFLLLIRIKKAYEVPLPSPPAFRKGGVRGGKVIRLFL